MIKSEGVRHPFNLNFSRRNVLFGTWLKETTRDHLVLILRFTNRSKKLTSPWSPILILFGRPGCTLARLPKQMNAS